MVEPRLPRLDLTLPATQASGLRNPCLLGCVEQDQFSSSRDAQMIFVYNLAANSPPDPLLLMTWGVASWMQIA